MENLLICSFQILVEHKGFVLYAELTSIPASQMYELTGSGINEGP